MCIRDSNKTGTIAIYNPDKNLFLSPFADGPLVFNKNIEGQEILNAISKFGRSFSVIRIPFALKLLIQELQVMNVQMRIITEDNIDQLTNLSFQSRNIDKLLHIDHGEDGKVEREIKEIVENYQKQMVKKIADNNAEKQSAKQTKIKVDANVDPQNIEEISLPENVPSAENMESPEYAPFSSYSPISENETKTPDYYKKTVLEDGKIDVAPKYKFPDDLGYYYLNLPKEEKIALENKSFEEKVEYLNNVKMNKKGGSINIFPNNANMNAAFNMLSGDSQSKILQMSEGEREIVMREIMRKTSRQTENNTNTNAPVTAQQSGGALNTYFQALPTKTQLEVLKGGYKSVSSEFSQLADKVDTPLVTIVRPPSIQQQIAGQFPLLAVETNTEISSDDKNTTSSDNATSSDNTTSSNTTSSDNTTRRITF